MADEITRQAGNLRRLATTQGWDADAGRTFAASAGDLAGRLDKAHGRYATAGGALKGYAPELRYAQSVADASLVDAQAAQGTINANRPPAAPPANPTPQQVSAERSRQTSYEDGVAALQAAQRKLADAVSHRDEAAGRAARAINASIDHDGLKDSWWDRFTNWVHEHADILRAIADIAEQVASVLGTIALLISWIPGLDVLSPILLGLAALASAVALVCNLMLALAGDGSWLDVAVGRRVHRRTSSGAERVWEYGAGQSPVAVRIGGRTVHFGYDRAGREVERRVGAGVLLAQSWDANHRLVSQTLTAAGPDLGLGSPVAAGEAAASARQARLVARRSYGYRPDGYLADVEDHLRGGRRFDLDPTGHVTAVHGDGWSERYGYDPVGNITDAAWPTPPDGVDSLQAWDGEDRLVAVTPPDGATWRYRYDPLGRRVAKQRLAPDGHTVAEQVDFTWDGALLAEQTHTTGPGDPRARTTTWEWEPGSFRPLAQTERSPLPDAVLRDAPQEWVDQRFYAIVTDLVGTPTEMVDPDGTLTWRPHTTLWGITVDGSTGGTGGVCCPLRFPGQYHDPETGLNYNYHRYYEPDAGRYQTSDPLGLAGGPNPHAYVLNPLGWTDPLGLTPCPGGDAVGRRGVLNQAKRDLGIPRSQQPESVDRVPNRDGPRVTLRFDLPEFPVRPPRKWMEQEANVVQVELMLIGIQRLKLQGWSHSPVVDLSVTKEQAFTRVSTAVGLVNIDIWSETAIISRISAYRTED